MCTNYTPSARDHLVDARFGVNQLPTQQWPLETCPGYVAPIIVRSPTAFGRGVAPVCLVSQFGLVPSWSRDLSHARDLSRHTYNARSESASSKPSFRGPWRERHWALVPMENFFEPCWEESRSFGVRPIRWRIGCPGREPFAAAGLWEQWRNPESGELIDSFTLLTVNADTHPLMSRMHRPGDEKRMPVIIDPKNYEAWLHASPAEAVSLIAESATQRLVGEPSPTAAQVAQPSLF